jgi:hypothetical protein
MREKTKKQERTVVGSEHRHSQLEESSSSGMPTGSACGFERVDGWVEKNEKKNSVL